MYSIYALAFYLPGKHCIYNGCLRAKMNEIKFRFCLKSDTKQVFCNHKLGKCERSVID